MKIINALKPYCGIIPKLFLSFIHTIISFCINYTIIIAS